jgi:hypothetical protein
MGLAATNHEQQNGWFPTGGWGYAWVGDPDRGFGTNQPGGFLYNVLPYMEQQTLHDIGQGTDAATKKQMAMTMVATPVAAFNCPTRRNMVVSPVRSNHAVMANVGMPGATSGWFPADYATNGGSVQIMWGYGPGDFTAAASNSGFSDMKLCDGVNFQRSRIKTADIPDGLSCTYLVGEKYIDPDNYFNDQDFGDDEPFLSADDLDLHRWTTKNPAYAPMQDQPGTYNTVTFGSAHATGFFMAFCDGSVQFLNYSINQDIHYRLGNRKDGLSVDGSKY